MSPKLKIFLRHIIIFAALAAYVLLYHKCIFREITNIPCPFCGLTRAYYSVLEFNFAEAFRYHPLFLFIPLLLMFAFHYRKLKFKERTANIIIIIGVTIILITYIIRLANGLII